MFEFKLPDLGEGVHEGQIVNVLVQEGQRVEEYQPLMEVETDKAAVEIPSPKSGVISKLHVKPGQQVKVGETLVVIEEGAQGAAGGAPAEAAPEGRSAAPLGRTPTEPKAPPQRTGAERSAAPAPQRAGAQQPAPARAGAERPGAPAARQTAPAQGQRAPAARPEAAPASRPGGVTGPASRPQPAGASRAAAHAPADTPSEPAEGPVPAAPAVRKLAREMGVDLHRVPPSGPGGRVLREDVERFAQGQNGGVATEVERDVEAEPGVAYGDVDARAGGRAPGAGPQVTIPGDGLPDFGQYGPIRRESPPQIRKTIARQMTRAWLSVPRVTHGDEADVTELEANRKSFNAGLREGEPKLTMTAIVIKAVAHALRQHQRLNCTWDAANEEIIFKDYVHIGVAVDTPRGLVVPVVRDVDRKPLPQIASELNGVAERARTAKFEIAELRGATFTVTNVGALGGTFSTPMVNFPEVAILALARAAWQPRVQGDKSMQIVPRFIMPVSLSFDHRIVDGADAARFCRDVIGSLENPLRLISM